MERILSSIRHWVEVIPMCNYAFTSQSSKHFLACLSSQEIYHMFARANLRCHLHLNLNLMIFNLSFLKFIKCKFCSFKVNIFIIASYVNWGTAFLKKSKFWISDSYFHQGLQKVTTLEAGYNTTKILSLRAFGSFLTKTNLTVSIFIVSQILLFFFFLLLRNLSNSL